MALILSWWACLIFSRVRDLALNVNLCDSLRLSSHPRIIGLACCSVSPILTMRLGVIIRSRAYFLKSSIGVRKSRSIQYNCCCLSVVAADDDVAILLFAPPFTLAPSLGMVAKVVDV